MSGIDWREHIVADPDVVGGKPRLKGTRLSVEFVLELLRCWLGPGCAAGNYPALTGERVRAVLAYAAATFSEERFYLLPH